MALYPLQWVAPFLIGLASLTASRVPRWQSIWVIGTGLVGSLIFAILAPGHALLVEGSIWLVLASIVYTSAHKRLAPNNANVIALDNQAG